MRRLRRILLWTLLILCLPIVLIAGGVAAFIWLAGEETWTAALRQGTEAASTPDQQINVDGFRRDGTGALRLARLSIADGQGDWLLAEDITIDLHPMRLFDRTIHLETVEARRVEVLRTPPPGTEPPASEEPFAFPDRIEIPELPVALELKKLEVGEIVLAEGVAPERTRLAANGDALASAERLSVNLNILPLDLGDSRLTAALSVDPETGKIAADIDGSLPVIEPLRSALAAPDGSRLNLNVTGGGPLSGSRLDFALNIDGVVDLIGDLEVTMSPDDGLDARLNAFANLLGGAVAEPAALIGPAVELQALVRLPEPERLSLESLVISAQFLQVEARGSVGLANEVFEIEANGTFRNHPGLDPLLQGATFEIAEFTARADGPIVTPSVVVDARLHQPAFDGFGAGAVRLQASAEVEGDGATGTVTLNIQEPVSADPQIAQILGPDVSVRTTYDADPKEVEFADLRVETAFARMTGDLTLDPTQSLVSGALVLTADRLPAAPPLAALLTTGKARIAVTLDKAGAQSGDVALDASFDELQWRDPALQKLTGTTMTLAGAADPGGTGALTLGAEGGLESNVKVAMTDGEISGTYRIAVPTVPGGLIPPEITGVGNIVLSGELSGAVDNPVLQARLTSSDLSINGVPVSAPNVAVSASNLTGVPDTTVRASARVMGEPLNFATSFTMDPGTSELAIRNLNLDWRSVQVSASGTANVNTLRTGIEATARADLSELGDLAGQPLAGNLDATLTSRRSGDRTDAVVDLNLARLEGAGASVNSLNAAIVLRDALSAVPALSGNIRIDGIRSGENSIEQIRIDLGGDVQRPVADINVAAAAPIEAVLSTRVLADLRNPDAVRATVETLKLAAEQGEISTRSAFTVTARGPAIELDGLDLSSSIGGSVRGNALYAPDRITTNIDIADLKIGPLAAIAGMEGFSGNANAQIMLDTTAPVDRGKITARIGGLTVPDVPSDTPFAVSLDAAWDGREATADAEITGPFDRPLTASVSGEMPADASSGLPEPPPDGRIAGGVAWQGDIARLLALLPESDHLAVGAASIDVKLAGTWSDPAMTGTVAIADARYENLLSGTQLSGIGMDISFNDAGEGKFTLAANGPEGGSISGDGELVLIGPNKGADIRISLRDLLAVRRDEVRAVVAGGTKLSWDGQRVKVEVRKVLERVDVFLAAPDLPPSVVAIELERDRDRTAEQEADAAPDLPIDLDIQVSSPGQFFVRGRGLESEWRGDLVVQGTASDPVIRSKFEAVRGSLSLLGRDFRLDKGELGLDESFKPDFRIELVRSTPDLTGRIIVSGSPEQPDISFTSEPELPPDEVLPRVLFDKAKQSLSPLEAVNLAQGIRTLTNGKPGTTDRIRDAVGLDVLRFEEGDTEESAGAVSVGRYVREGVYVGAKKSVDSDAGSVVVEIDLLPNVKVDTEVGQDGGTSTGITWEKKY